MAETIGDIIKIVKNKSNLSEITVEDYAVEGGFADVIAKEAGAESTKHKLKSNQLRKFFSAVRLLDQKEEWVDIKPGFYLLRPQLAYAKGRDKIPENFFDVMVEFMKKVPSEDDSQSMENFNTFVSIFESIVAYFKYHYSKN